MDYSFGDMLNYLENSREIEFDVNGLHYAIINGNGKWFFCTEKHSTELCDFEEKGLLIKKVKSLILQNETIENVVNKKRYDEGTLYIL